MTDSNRENMMATLTRLRAMMDEVKIFLTDERGGITLSPLAFQKLAEMRLKDAEQWREDHREEAERVAADVLADWPADFNPPILVHQSKCGCDWTPTSKGSDTDE
ncbi:hypothetical protein [Nocardia wallacei]|uniref:hypothetical protein n=1 Tax=Nocardia wallacei TaxID=480035 RepID=UPI002455CEF5|nr:hypothetical protein [Nocardia wallacei]